MGRQNVFPVVTWPPEKKFDMVVVKFVASRKLPSTFSRIFFSYGSSYLNVCQLEKHPNLFILYKIIAHVNQIETNMDGGVMRYLTTHY